jgi:hypothetical protein
MGDTLDGHAMARCLELREENGRNEEEDVAAAEEQRSGKIVKRKGFPLK